MIFSKQFSITTHLGCLILPISIVRISFLFWETSFPVHVAVFSLAIRTESRVEYKFVLIEANYSVVIWCHPEQLWLQCYLKLLWYILGSFWGYRHDDVIKWKHFPRCWPFVRGFHRSPVNSPHKGQWRGALMFSLICVWINGLVNNREAGDLRRYRAHYDVNVMIEKLTLDGRHF